MKTFYILKCDCGTFKKILSLYLIMISSIIQYYERTTNFK